MDISIDGLDDLQKKIKDLQKRAKALDGENLVPLVDLLTIEFLNRYTSFSSVEELFEASGFKVDNTEDFEKIPNDEWDEFISKNSIFKNWEEMLEKAGEEWITNELGLW